MHILQQTSNAAAVSTRYTGCWQSWRVWGSAAITPDPPATASAECRSQITFLPRRSAG